MGIPLKIVRYMHAKEFYTLNDLQLLIINGNRIEIGKRFTEANTRNSLHLDSFNVSLSIEICRVHQLSLVYWIRCFFQQFQTSLCHRRISRVLNLGFSSHLS